MTNKPILGPRICAWLCAWVALNCLAHVGLQSYQHDPLGAIVWAVAAVCWYLLFEDSREQRHRRRRGRVTDRE
jgi:hypothetical protein